MRVTVLRNLIACGIIAVSSAGLGTDQAQASCYAPQEATQRVHAEAKPELIRDDQVQLCQGYDDAFNTGTQTPANTNGEFVPGFTPGFSYTQPVEIQGPTRCLQGVDQFTKPRRGVEAKWQDSEKVPWESMAYGEYIGPYRKPAVGQYRLRVNDQLEFVYLRTREKSLEPYQLFVGDSIRITSAIDASLNQESLIIRSDGMVSLPLIGQVGAAGKTVENLQLELDERYSRYVKNPAMVVQVTQGETPLQDIINSVDATRGRGGQGRAATVSPDGTIQLPGIGSIPAIGLSLNELGREINARYQGRQGGIEITPILTQRAARFIYVVGEVDTPGRFEMVGPTSALQAIALAGGYEQGGNTRQIVVFRRDQNWRLTATLLDLNGALLGKRPHPSDEIWLRDSDIVLIPKKPIQRISEAVDQYLTETLYSIYPQQAIFGFDSFTSL